MAIASGSCFSTPPTPLRISLEEVVQLLAALLVHFPPTHWDRPSPMDTLSLLKSPMLIMLPGERAKRVTRVRESGRATSDERALGGRAQDVPSPRLMFSKRIVALDSEEVAFKARGNFDLFPPTVLSETMLLSHPVPMH